MTSRRRRTVAAIVGGLLVGVPAIVGCGPTPGSATPQVRESPAVSVASVAPVASSPPPSTAGVAKVDQTLLLLLPTDVGGVPLTADPETAALIAADTTLARSVEGVALVTAFGPMPTDGAGDYVVATLARLRAGAFGEIFYRGWRDSFDAAVCDQAGGVDGHAEAEIAGHRTYIATCSGGVRTYHVYLPESDVIVSMQSLGEGRFGERVIAGLTE